MRSEYHFKAEVQHILSSLMPENRIVLEVSLATGLRLSDVLNMRSDKLCERMSIRELKTGKRRQVYIPAELLRRMRSMCGKIYVFEHRLSQNKHRTRQAVFKDLKRSAKLFRVKCNLSPHSMRKVYAVEEYHRTCDLKRIQKLLNHDSEAVTMLYALADEIVSRNYIKKSR